MPGGAGVATGPKLPLTSTSNCCGAARRSGHSGSSQHFFDLNVGVRDEADSAI